MSRKEVRKLHRGDLVEALRLLDPRAACVQKGTRGVVFELDDAYGDGNGPMVRWFRGTACNVYDGDVKVVYTKSVADNNPYALYNMPNQKRATEAITRAINKSVNKAFRVAASQKAPLEDAITSAIRDNLDPVLDHYLDFGARDTASRSAISDYAARIFVNRIGSTLSNLHDMEDKVRSCL